MGASVMSPKMGKEWYDMKRPMKTDDKKLYGNDVKPEKGNNTTPKVSKNYGSAQRAAMKPKDVACNHKK